MKTFLLPESGSFYKANLHCHTTLSDGRKTPEEIKELYRSHGYSVVAFTDHDILIAHPELADEHFLPLNGFEAEVNESKDCGMQARKTCHLCFVSLDPDNLTMPFYHRERYLFGNAPNYRDQLKFDESKPDFVRSYTPECINEMIALGRENGFFVTYNHPTWSLEDYPDYTSYRGLNAMEICNYSCAAGGCLEFNQRVYDDMLRANGPLFCLATDDNHNVHPQTSGHWDSFGGFVMIKAEELSYKAIAKALSDGSFYASTGPRIHDLWVENGRLHLTCSGASKINLNTGRRRFAAAYSQDGELLERASFALSPEDIYFRVTITDPRGYTAYTQAYFLDNLPDLF